MGAASCDDSALYSGRTFNLHFINLRTEVINLSRRKENLREESRCKPATKPSQNASKPAEGCASEQTAPLSVM